jgi:membrane protease YdiL (CAAX protease family)
LLALALDVRLESPLPAPTNGPESLAIALAAVVVAPIGEETFFRGFALTAWWRDLGAAPALVRSTVFFALVHIANVSADTAGEGLKLVLLQFAVILPVGYVLGWLFIRRGIVASIAGHMTFNAITIALLLAFRGS